MMVDMKRIKYYKIVCLLLIQLLLIAGFASYGQQNETFKLENVTENIMLNTDRDIYFAGEQLHFSAQYFINQIKTKPVISNVIYVELINCVEKNSVVQKKYEIRDFIASGTITIPKDVASGSYVIRAYTQYQRNFGYLSFTCHFITILNPENNKNVFTLDENADSIEIVPEGNLLLDNITNNVVIRIPRRFIQDENKYFVTDKDLNVIENVEVQKNGFAEIEIIGNQQESYNFVVRKSNGEQVVKAFPKTETKGIQTQIRQTETAVEYLVQTKGLEKMNGNLDYQIKVLSNDLRVKYSKNINLDNSSISNKIQSEFFDEGINYVVLISSNGVIEKVNALFFKSKEIANVNIITEENRFSTRENINARILLENGYKAEMPIVSVTVIKQSTKIDDKYLNSGLFCKNPFLIQDYLLKNSEMDETTRTRISVLFGRSVDKDLLAKQINNTKTLSLDYIPEIRSLTLSGIVRNRETLQPVVNQNIYLSVPFNYPQLHVCKSRNDGSFIFSLNNVRGINDIFLCPENMDDDDYEILITNPFSNEIPDFGDFQAFVDSSDIEMLNELFVNAQINQKFYPKTEVDSLQRERKSTFNIDNGKSTVLLSDFVTLKNMEELFTEIVPTAKYRKNKARYSFAIFDLKGNITSENPLLLLDKIPVFDANKIMELDISLIEKVEVINRYYVMGENTFNGIIMITTKTKNFAGIGFPKSSIFIEYPTIQQAENNKLFSSENLPVDKRTPDFRTTLFWDPKVKMLQHGIDINFQTSDSKGTYDIIVKGFSTDGKPFYGRKQIIVE
jgi:hypothetical protein